MSSFGPQKYKTNNDDESVNKHNYISNSNKNSNINNDIVKDENNNDNNINDMDKSNRMKKTYCLTLDTH